MLNINFSIYVLKIKFPVSHVKVVNDLQVAYQKTYFISLLDQKVYTLAGGSMAVLFFCFCFLLCPNDAVMTYYTFIEHFIVSSLDLGCAFN